MFAWLIKTLKKANMLPKISDTERAALEAGTVWVEGELFRGKPDFAQLMAEAYPELTEAEKAFLDGPVEDVCNMVKSWDVKQSRSLPKEVWDFLSEHRFFGLLVPEEFGGKGFREIAFSAVLGKLGTHSMTLNTVVLIPNSIGPSELILHYGTEEQKKHYLPRLCKGQEIPCFALTEPNAGSDAASMTSNGELFKDSDGELKIRLNWSKRYITLAPIATLLGLAFKLRDPDNLLGKGTDLGITCALVPTDLPGVAHGRRHDPLGVAFPNGPTEGRDVVIPAANIIGGLDEAGKGWEMLMKALSAGRAISLPAGAAAGAKAAARLTSSYATLRQQFGMSIAQFEGIEEPLARIGGKAYLMEACRVYTAGSLHTGQKPAVASAIAKYHTTELAREVLNDSMDILGGKAICVGPKNPIADGYAGAPIAITVEGANILTRTLIIFGQGALRCHPYMQREVAALESENPSEFRNALIGHFFFGIRNALLASFAFLTRGLFSNTGGVAPESRKYVRRIKWASAMYALFADLCAVTNGPKLKQRGKLAGRFADALSWMFLGTAVLRRYEAEGRQKADLPLLRWSMEYSLFKVQQSFEGIFANFGVPVLGTLLRWFALPMLRLNRLGAAPSDDLGAEVARLMQSPSASRDRLSGGVFIAKDLSEPAALFERAFNLAWETRDAQKALKRAMRKGELPKSLAEALPAAVAVKLITQDDADKIAEAERLRDEVLAVDAFSPNEYFQSATVDGEAVLNGRELTIDLEPQREAGRASEAHEEKGELAAAGA
jgi:acyl-CoA dehydrogenase